MYAWPLKDSSSPEHARFIEKYQKLIHSDSETERDPLNFRPAMLPDRYDRVSILLHWLTVLLVCVLFGLGWYMDDLPKGSAERSTYFSLHKSVGLTTALVVFFRLAWRVTHVAPPLPGSIRAWQRKLAGLTHVLLYVLLVVQPLSGYLSASFAAYPTRWWGIPLPHWGWKDVPLNELFSEIHEISAIILLCVIGLHVLGALSHLAGPDDVMGRMLPRRGRLPPAAADRIAAGGE